MTTPPSASRELFGRGSIYTVTTALQLSAGLLILPAATRLLGPRSYGIVATALVIVQILTLLASLGLPAAITRAHFKSELGEDAAKRLVGLAIAAVISVTLMTGLSAPLWSKLFAEFGGTSVLGLAILTASFLAILKCTQALLRARGQAWAFASVAVISSVGGQSLGVVLAYLVRAEAVWYLVGMALGAAAGGILGLVATGARAPNPRLVRWGFALGLPVVPHSLSLYVMHAGDRVVIERLEGLEAVGSYHVAYLIGGLGITVVSALNNAWAPIVYRESESTRIAVLVETSRLVHNVAAAMTVVLALLAPIALRVAAPESFGGSDLLPVVALVAMSTLPQVSYHSNGHLLFQYERTGSLGFITPLVAAVNVALNLVLVPRFGLPAAAAATFLAYALQAELVRRARRRIVAVAWRKGSLLAAYTIGGTGCLLGVGLPVDGAGLGSRIAIASLVTVWGARTLRRLWA